MDDEYWASIIRPADTVKRTEPASSIEVIAYNLLFEPIDDKFLMRINPNGELSSVEGENSQGHVLGRIAAHLRDLADLSNSRKPYLLSVANNVKKLQLALAFLAGDSPGAHQFRERNKAAEEASRAELRDKLIAEGKNSEEIDDIFSQEDQHRKITAQNAFITKGHDNALKGASIILAEAADVLMKDWQEKKATLVAPTPEELHELIGANKEYDDVILDYKRTEPNPQLLAGIFYDPVATVAAYTDGIKARAEVILAFKDKLEVLLSPVLQGQKIA